ncbi:hypothetical protein [Propionibacterium australiense]|uniref:Lipoprotein-like n=1 Tax=Propionibacterium australiense TaxID=119981 RepID=A0A383S866_9ACTN|nr:hypothetical protein [Propionibacterium australiense]RLP09544.1 hypothetical protein D9T14_07270 [Propionibacterium australiense]RLP09879.1 hypothetical protein D7U36_06775 [Propionibacterium australiense]SYZ34190.1 Lipoprotein-like [Propionibacterium australiense]VEH89439.1 Uncharacterised protein [Propionibacterium australiense]
MLIGSARTRAALCALLAGALVLTGCARRTGTDEPSGSPTPSRSAATASPDTSPTPAYDLTRPGRARQIIDFLRRASGERPVLRIEITVESANLTYLSEDEEAETIGYANGSISHLDATIEYIDQAQFDPDDFAFDDVAALFETAARISGSDQEQDLQINEYDHGNVLMTVTTTPESSTVFFRDDGSVINKLNLTRATDIAEALADTVKDSPRIISARIDRDALTVRVRIDESTVEERTRRTSLPTIVSTLKNSDKNPSFDPAAINPEVVARLIAQTANQADNASASDVSVWIGVDAGGTEPRMRFQVGSTEIVTDMNGMVQKQ